MRVSVEWLRDYVDLRGDRKELEELFSSMGFPPEEIVEWGDDLIFDLEVTPNRPDCLSHYGVAREISVFRDLELKPVDFFLEEDERSAEFPIEIKDPDLCPRYVARIVEGVKVGESPDWLVEKLEKMGLQSVNSVVDLSNFLLYAIGHPTHVFDLDKLSGAIVIRRVREGEKLLCLDGVERTLTPDDLVIADRRGPVAIAGVIGGEETGVDFSTTRVLIESAYFHPVAIRKTSRRLGLTTDASYRFERGADPKVQEFAADYLAYLIKEVSGGRILRGRLVAGGYEESRRIIITFPFINSRIGQPVDRDFVVKKIAKAGAEVKVDGDKIEVIPPSWRRDLEIPEDIVEEVVRFMGYGAVEGKLPPVEAPQGLHTPERELLWRLRNYLAGLGYSEAMTYIWTSEEADRFSGGKGEPLRIKNPIIKEMPLLRRSLVPTLLESVSLNLRMGRKGVRLFEIGRVYWKEGRPKEEKRLAILEAGEVKERTWEAPPQQASFYSLKGTVEALLERFSLAPAFELASHPMFEDGFFLQWEGVKIGVLKKELLSIFSIEIPVFAAEIPISVFPYQAERKYEDLARFPYVRRDISMTFPSEVKFEQVRKIVASLSIPILKNFRLIDLYQGGGIGEGRKSMTFSLEFRAGNRTLTSEEVDAEVQRVVEKLEKELSGALRR